MRNIDSRPKCGGEKPQSGYALCAVFRSPSCLLAAKRKQDCYVTFFNPATYQLPAAMDGGGHTINFYTII
jgi:hypothetical protein